MLRNALAEKFKYIQNQQQTLTGHVFLLDLDGFKLANDQYGHDVGDQVLKIIARRLQSCVRSKDMVARIGGDEFVVITVGQENPISAEKKARTIIETIKQAMKIDTETSIQLGVSIGISCFPQQSTDFTTLIKYADQAMYTVKHQGKNGYAVYNKIS